jgi:hypothetical protein
MDESWARPNSLASDADDVVFGTGKRRAKLAGRLEPELVTPGGSARRDCFYFVTAAAMRRGFASLAERCVRELLLLQRLTSQFTELLLVGRVGPADEGDPERQDSEFGGEACVGSGTPRSWSASVMAVAKPARLSASRSCSSTRAPQGAR